jgi:hypothetical protein
MYLKIDRLNSSEKGYCAVREHRYLNRMFLRRPIGCRYSCRGRRSTYIASLLTTSAYSQMWLTGPACWKPPKAGAPHRHLPAERAQSFA